MSVSIRRQSIGRLAALLGVVLVTQGCFPGEHSTILTAPNGMRTFTTAHGPDGVEILCTLGRLMDPMHGVVEGELGAREPVWLRTDDGRAVSVIWPEGFTVRFDPMAILLDASGAIVARQGEMVELSDVSPDEHAGTYDDPFVAKDKAFGCHHYAP